MSLNADQFSWNESWYEACDHGECTVEECESNVYHDDQPASPAGCTEALINNKSFNDMLWQSAVGS